MKYQMKQALMSFGDDFSIRDESGKECFYFDGQVMSLGKKIIIKDASKEEVARIQQKWFCFSPTFRLMNRGTLVATIRKKLFTIRPSFLIDIPGGKNITVVGKMMEHDYRFFRDKREIATCSKRWFTGKDTYGIEIKSSADPLLILSAAAIVDIILHPKRDSSF